jgi:hypothetical protein
LLLLDILSTHANPEFKLVSARVDVVICGIHGQQAEKIVNIDKVVADCTDAGARGGHITGYVARHRGWEAFIARRALTRSRMCVDRVAYPSLGRVG